jgi:hypothetical protein
MYNIYIYRNDEHGQSSGIRCTDRVLVSQFAQLRLAQKSQQGSLRICFFVVQKMTKLVDTLVPTKPGELAVNPPILKNTPIQSSFIFTAELFIFDK